MPPHPLETELKAALAAIRHAQDVRRHHARRTKRGTKQREEDLRLAKERVGTAMTPLRSYLGRAPWETGSQGNEALTNRVREASKALQSERRKLWKMQDKDKRKEPIASDEGRE